MASFLVGRERVGYPLWTRDGVGGKGLMRRQGRVRGVLGAVAAGAILLGGCSPIYRNHGYAPSDAELASLRLGQDTRDSVASAVGRPTTGGVLGENGFYYVESRFRHQGLLAPQEVEREVLALSFAPDGTLGAIERFGLQDGRAVAVSRRITPGVFADPSVIDRIAANFGGLDTGGLLGEDSPEP